MVILSQKLRKEKKRSNPTHKTGCLFCILYISEMTIEQEAIRVSELIDEINSRISKYKENTENLICIDLSFDGSKVDIISYIWNELP